MRIKELELLLQREQIAEERAERYKKFEQDDLSWPKIRQEHEDSCRRMGYNDLAGDTTLTYTDTDWTQRQLYQNGKYVQADYHWAARSAAMNAHALKVVLLGLFCLYIL